MTGRGRTWAQSCATLFTGTNRGLDERENASLDALGKIRPGANGSGRCPGRQPARFCYVNCYVDSRLKSVSISVTGQFSHQERGKTATFEPVSSQINVARDFKTSAFLGH